MLFSKSFAYSLRGILFVANAGSSVKKIRVEDISKETGIPRHFLGKIMNKMVKGGIVLSIKGPSGGFYISQKTLETPLIQLYQLFEGTRLFEGCVLRLHNCDEQHACPLHFKVEDTKKNIRSFLSHTTIGDLLKDESALLMKTMALEGISN